MNHINPILGKDIGSIIFDYLTINKQMIKRNRNHFIEYIELLFENGGDKCSVDFPRYVRYAYNYTISMQIFRDGKFRIFNQISGLYECVR